MVVVELENDHRVIKWEHSALKSNHSAVKLLLEKHEARLTEIEFGEQFRHFFAYYSSKPGVGLWKSAIRKKFKLSFESLKSMSEAISNRNLIAHPDTVHTTHRNKTLNEIGLRISRDKDIQDYHSQKLKANK